MLTAISCGTLLLGMPWAQQVPVSWFDCLFTAVSTACVTGLETVPFDSFTTSGHIVMLLLMQIGAIGLITFTVFFLSFFMKLGLSAKLVTGEALELSGGQHPNTLVKFTILFTMLIELIGWISCFIILKPHFPFPQALFYSLFHAISSFCNAGITIVPLTAPTLGTISHLALLLVTSCLVLVGGLGFIVWRELTLSLTVTKNKHSHLSLHTRLALLATAYLVGIATVIIFILEYARSFYQNPGITPFVEALFNAICLRSAGCTTLPIAAIQAATLLIIMMLSFIGSSPGSTGSGIKTTTFAIFVSAIKATLLHRSSVEAQHRTIPNDQVFKAMSIFALSAAFIALATFLLFITDAQLNPFDSLFEVFSAFTNLGLSRGITATISRAGQIIIMISMLIGRIGSLTLLLAFTKHGHGFHEVYYPEERVFID